MNNLQLYVSSYEDYISAAIKDRYNLMYSIDVHDKMRPTGNDYSSSGGDRPLPYKSTVDVILSLVLTMNSIYSWLQ